MIANGENPAPDHEATPEESLLEKSSAPTVRDLRAAAHGLLTTTIKTFEFKLRLNKSFVVACERELEHSRQIYNAALAERISCYRITGVSLGYNEQSRHLTEARALPEVKSHLRAIQQDALERVDEAFKGL
ncbi:MAG TPA: hypothetical protein VG324_03285, partial [Blastocatellia bacterium]|nr:hypothetical protein [Blastocatellia bacterium]